MMDVFNETISQLQETGFSKILSTENRQGAIKAIKAHFGFYRVLGPLQQFLDGNYKQYFMPRIE